MNKKDYYEVLGVSKTATEAEIKSAFRKLAKQHHPDVSKEAGSAEKFKEAQEAYAVLSDESKRKQYDQYGHAAFNNNGGSSQGAGYDFSGFDFSDDYSLIYGHHMENDLMFGALDHYLKKGYLEKHNKGTIYVDDVPYKLKLFAVGESEATNEIIFAPTFADAGTVCSYIKQNALYFDESVKMQKNDKIIALSTCKYPDTVERTLVFGYLTMD